MMKNKTNLIIVFLSLFVTAIVGCSNKPNATETPDLASTAKSMAETIVASTLNPVTISNSGTRDAKDLLATPSPGPSAELDLTPFLPIGICYKASLASETIPDESEFAPGTTFEKTWWLTNTGDCAWTEEYTLILHSGNRMGAPERTAFAGWVAPGQSIPLTLSMTAPMVPGDHIGHWTIETPEGTTFGAGQRNTIWVDIIVSGIAENTKSKNIHQFHGGTVQSDGKVSTKMKVGDNSKNEGIQAFVTFDLQTIPSDAAITQVLFNFNEGYVQARSPFDIFGCLNVFQYGYGELAAGDYINGSPGYILWSYCSYGDLNSRWARIGNGLAIDAVQSVISNSTRFAQFRIQFPFKTDGNELENSLSITNIILNVEWIVP